MYGGEDMIPVTDAVTLILACCGGISVIGAAAVYIGKAVGWIRKPEHRQDEILQDHEKRITTLESKTDKDYVSIQGLQEEMAMVLKAVVAIMKHEINGNDTESLKKVQREIEDYLISK